MDPDRKSLLLMLLRDGSTGQAIRLFQEEAGVNYFDARRAVSRLAQKHGLRDGACVRRTCALFLLAIAIGFLLSH
jgi:hypothetical protein